MAARVLVALVAVAVLAWLAVMERDARLLARGLEAARPPRAAGDLARAEASFRAARLLNPDTDPDIGRAVVQQAAGRQGDAAAVLDEVLRREPDNRVAWNLLLTFTRTSDPVTAQRARLALARLDPLNARRP